VVSGENRVRGRVANPGGWISLLDTSNGYRWAEKAALLSFSEKAEAMQMEITVDKLTAFERLEKKADDAVCIAKQCMNEWKILQTSVNQVKVERLNALEERLDSVVAQAAASLADKVSAEINQEKILREAMNDAMTVKLDTVVGLVEKVIGTGGSLSPERAALLYDSPLSDRTRPDDELGGSMRNTLEARCEELISAQVASSRDLEAAEAALRSVSGDVAQVCETHWQQILKVAEGMTALGREITRRLDKTESTSVSQAKKIAELGLARTAESKRLDEQGAKLRTQNTDMKSQSECLSTAIDAILQWIGESESSGLAAVVERLSSLHALSDSDPKPEGIDLDSLKAAFGSQRLAAKDALGATRGNLILNRREPIGKAVVEQMRGRATEVGAGRMSPTSSPSRTGSPMPSIPSPATTVLTAGLTMPNIKKNIPSTAMLTATPAAATIAAPTINLKAFTTLVSSVASASLTSPTPLGSGVVPDTGGNTPLSAGTASSVSRGLVALRAEPSIKRRVQSSSPSPGNRRAQSSSPEPGNRRGITLGRNVYASAPRSTSPSAYRRSMSPTINQTPMSRSRSPLEARSRSPIDQSMPVSRRYHYTRKLLAGAPPTLLEPLGFSRDVKTFGTTTLGGLGVSSTSSPVVSSPNSFIAATSATAPALTSLSGSVVGGKAWSETTSTMSTSGPVGSTPQLASRLPQATAPIPTVTNTVTLSRRAPSPIPTSSDAGGRSASPKRGLSPEGGRANASILDRTQRPFRRLIQSRTLGSDS